MTTPTPVPGAVPAVNDDVCEVVITADNAQWLTDFARSLVTERLAACGQLSSPIRSIYRWAGEIHDEPESRVALHTRVSLVTRIIEETTRRHPYDVPCVIALPIIAANPAYVRWIQDETRPPAS